MVPCTASFAAVQRSSSSGLFALAPNAETEGQPRHIMDEKHGGRPPPAREDVRAVSPNASEKTNRNASPPCRTHQALLTLHASTPFVVPAGGFAVDDHEEIMPVHHSGFPAGVGLVYLGRARYFQIWRGARTSSGPLPLSVAPPTRFGNTEFDRDAPTSTTAGNPNGVQALSPHGHQVQSLSQEQQSASKRGVSIVLHVFD